MDLTAEFDCRAVLRALDETGHAMDKPREGLKKAADLVLNEWQGRVPVQTGHFRSSGRSSVIGGGGGIQGKVELRGSHNRHDYIGVNEFGGTVRWRGRGDVTGGYSHMPLHGGGEFRTRRVAYIPIRPSMHGSGSYFLYPSLDDKRDDIADILAEYIYDVWNRS